MNPATDNAPPQRSVPERILIRSWEYRHLRAWAGIRIGVGAVSTVCGILTLGFGGSDRKTYGWAALFLVPAALAFAFSYWEITIARSASART
jgi:hypothetical protein